MTAESYQQKQFSIQSFQIKRHSNISNSNHSCKLCICNTYISGSITSCCLKKPLLATYFSPSNMSQSKPSSMSQSNPGKNSRKREEMGDTEIPRLLKKRTLILGEEVESSSSEEEEANEDTIAKINRLFPGWWQEDQHLAECRCQFCQLMFGRTPADPEDQAVVSTSTSTATGGSSNSLTSRDSTPCPLTPDAA